MTAEHGVADLQTEEPAVDDMLWPLRSITQSVVVTVTLQLVDEGQLSLEYTIDMYVGGAPNGDVETEDDWADPHSQGHPPSEGHIEPIFSTFSSMGASGAMDSTTDDMTVWAEALVTGELISPELHNQRLLGAPLTEGPEYDEYALGLVRLMAGGATPVKGRALPH